ncbi:MAG: hypothetical protein AABY22_30485 [Nanoarchaeota archaeon]
MRILGQLASCFCPSCHDVRLARYNGIQKDEEQVPLFYLYTCSFCYTTFSQALDKQAYNKITFFRKGKTI